MVPIMDMSEVKKALEEYDAYEESIDWQNVRTVHDLANIDNNLEALGRTVGQRFGEATRDRNSIEICAGCVRPGPKIPSPGATLSLVRQCVKDWEEKQQPK